MRDIIGWEGKYRISDSGEVFSARGIKKKTTLNKERGYEYITLQDGKRRKNYAYHRLIAENLLPKPNEGYLEVNHKDGNKVNNTLDNLEWVTRSENHKHAYRLGLQSVNRRSSLRKEDIIEIRSLRKSGLLHREIAKRFNVAVCTITLILSGRRWGDV